MIFQPLLDYDDGVNLVPLVAEAMPTLSEDGKTYTFHLRKGVHFSNGRDVTADDFVYSWQRVLDPATKSPGASYIADRIAGCRIHRLARAETSGEAARLSADEKPLAETGRGCAPDAYTLEVSWSTRT